MISLGSNNGYKSDSWTCDNQLYVPFPFYYGMLGLSESKIMDLVLFYFHFHFPLFFFSFIVDHKIKKTKCDMVTGHMS